MDHDVLLGTTLLDVTEVARSAIERRCPGVLVSHRCTSVRDRVRLSELSFLWTTMFYSGLLCYGGCT